METRRFSIDHILTIPNDVLAVREILAGTFDDEMKRINAARAELDAKMTVVKTLDAAAKVKAEADAAATAANASTNARLLDAKSVQATAQAKLDAVNQAHATLQIAVAAHNTAKAAWESDKVSAAAAAKAKADELAARENAVTLREQQLAADRAKLDNDRGAFNRRLDQLKVA